MVGEKVDFDVAAEEAVASDRSKRERSTIDFPYMPLEAAIEVASAVYSRCGFGSCEQDELAAEMGQTVSGAFRQKTAAARTFRLVEKDGRSAFRLTELGKAIVVPETEKAARVNAFLAVPLYEAIFERFRGRSLPPAKALEREMENLGVARKQTERARQAFSKSAQFAGFFDSGTDRLVRPRLEQDADQLADIQESTPPEDNESSRSSVRGGGSNGGGSGRLPPNVDPIIAGLIDRLPPSGSRWPKAKRKLWLQILENSFDLVYEDDDPESVGDGEQESASHE